MAIIPIMLAPCAESCTKRAEIQPPPERVYTVNRATVPITIDGVLDDAAWKNAEKSGPFVFADGNPARPSLKTEAMMLWDDKNLYVAFDVEDHNIWADYKNFNDPIYEEEVVELFVNPNDDMREYYEFQTSPANVRFNAFFTNHRSDLRKAMEWRGNWRSAVKIDGKLNSRNGTDKGWTVEMELPFSMFQVTGGKTPKPGSHWRADMFRFERPSRNRIIEAHAWSPTPNWDFHDMQRWGWIVFNP